MDRRNALKAVVAGAIGMLSHQAIFTRKAKAGALNETGPEGMLTIHSVANWKPDNIEWNLGQYKTLTLRFGDQSVVLDTREIFDALRTGS